jgi:hypothetical protein
VCFANVNKVLIGYGTGEYLMDDQNISRPVENKFPKILSIVLRGILGGVVGGGVGGLAFGVVLGLFESSYRYSYTMSDFLWTVKFIVVEFGIPIGLIIGISTGIFVAIFRHRSPRLLWWLVLSWAGVMTGFYPPFLLGYGWQYDAFIGISLTSLAASWMAYIFTIREIKKETPKEVPESYLKLSLMLTFLLISIMNFVYFFLLLMED